VIDDLETNESCETPDRIAKNLDFLKRTVEPIGDPNRTKIVFIGTVITHNCVLNTVINKYSDWKSLKYRAIMRFPTNMHLWGKWEELYHSRDDGDTPEESSRLARIKAVAFYEENREAMHDGCECLWPERMDLLRLMEIRAQNRLAFNSEFQNTALDPDTAIFTKIWKYRLEEIDLSELEIFGACDPSIGQTKRSDPSAIITVGRHLRSGIIYVLDVDARRRSPDDTIIDIFRKAQQYNYSAFSIETVAFQQFMRDELVKRSTQTGVYLPVKDFRSTVKKEVRIASLEPLVTSGIIRIQSSHQNLEEQLLYFPRGTQHDDCADVLSQVMELAKKRSGSFLFGKI
jgi:predicted phage terminase large subunit-like protein